MQKASKRAFIRKLNRIGALFAALVCIGSALCCTPADPNAPARREVFAMDTYMNIACYGKSAEKAADTAVSEIKRIDALLSITSASGSVHSVNETGSAEVGEETAKIIERALDIHNKTGGAFDITVLPLMELWGFTSGNYRVPDKSEIDAALERVGSEKLSVSGDKVSLGGASGIDLGGIAKGYTSDRLIELFKESGLASACVSLGGNVQCLGAKPDGSAWRCGIVHPFKKDSGEYLGIVSVIDKAVITSGAYERNFTDENGVRFHHIIDPKTGYPAETGLASVTIVSESGILADALSTACYIMGLDGASAYWRNSKEQFDMILMTNDGRVYITEGISESFTSELEVHIINR